MLGILKKSTPESDPEVAQLERDEAELVQFENEHTRLSSAMHSANRRRTDHQEYSKRIESDPHAARAAGEQFARRGDLLQRFLCEEADAKDALDDFTRVHPPAELAQRRTDLNARRERLEREAAVRAYQRHFLAELPSIEKVLLAAVELQNEHQRISRRWGISPEPVLPIATDHDFAVFFRFLRGRIDRAFAARLAVGDRARHMLEVVERAGAQAISRPVITWR